jgi:hypothetical protein
MISGCPEGFLGTSLIQLPDLSNIDILVSELKSEKYL